MKKILSLLMFLFPIVLVAQQPWYKSSPLDYMWMNVGNAGFSAGATEDINLVIRFSGQPYVSYIDGANDYKVTVMKYDSVYVGINEPRESRLSLYPNPATHKITIEISKVTVESNLVIENIEGQALITRQITEPKTQLDINTLPNGVYFVRVMGERTVLVGKFVKQ